MKKMHIALTLFFASLDILAADFPNINIENQADFKLNIPYLSQGNIQYYSGHYEEKSFTQLPKDLIALDETGTHKLKGVHLLVYRYAYIIPVKPNYLFDNHLYADQEFILANNGNVSEVKYSDQKNALLQIHTFREMKGKKGIAVYNIQHSEIKSLNGARTMKSQTIDPDDGLLITATTLAHYYPFGDATLVVTHKFAALKPSFKLKIGFGTGLAQHFLREEENVLVRSVIETRHYLQKRLLNEKSPPK